MSRSTVTDDSVLNRRNNDDQEDNQEAVDLAPRLEMSSPLSLPIVTVPAAATAAARRRLEPPLQSLLPLEEPSVAVPRAGQHTINSMRLPGINGRGSLIDCKNTLQSHSMAEFRQAAAPDASAIWYDASSALPAPNALQVQGDIEADAPVWTGFYKQIQGVVGSTRSTTFVTAQRPATSNDWPATSGGICSVNDAINCSDLEKDRTSDSMYNHNSPLDHSKNAMPFDSIIAISDHSSSPNDKPTTARTGGLVPHRITNTLGDVLPSIRQTECTDDVREAEDTDVVFHAYLAQDLRTPRFKRVCWIATLCAIFVVVLASVVAILVVFYLPAFNESERVPIVPTATLGPSAAPTADNRAARVTAYINSIKLSNGTLNAPLQSLLQEQFQVSDDDTPLRHAMSAEDAALAWLIHDDPLRLSPFNDDNRFRLKQRYALLTLLSRDESAYTWALKNTDSECEWPLVANCTVSAEQSNRAYVTRIAVGYGYGDGDGYSVTCDGTLSPDVGLLTSIKNFDMSDCFYTGSLPSVLSTAWSNLRHFDVSGDLLTGSLPSTFGTAWTNIQTIDMSGNAWTGSLPSSLGLRWTNLRSFSASSYGMGGGSLPSLLGTTWTNIETFDVPTTNFQEAFRRCLEALGPIYNVLTCTKMI